MSEEYKARIRAACEAAAAKQLPKPPRAPNGRPEAEFLLELKNYLIGHHKFSMTIIESKANYSESAGRYQHGAVASGYPDLSGNAPNGLAVFIEVKAPGKRGTIRPAQRDFLLEKIRTNCFAICCDSIQYFETVWNEYKLRAFGEGRQNYLENELPELAPRYREKEFDLK